MEMFDLNSPSFVGAYMEVGNSQQAGEGEKG